MHSSDTAKANLLANHFRASFNTASYGAPSLPQCASSLEYLQFSPAELSRVLSRLPRRVSTSPDQLPYIILKECAIPLALPLSIIFQRFLLHGTVPTIWGTAIVKPLYKRKGNKNNPSSYRAISLTCATSKVMERLIASSLTVYLRENNLHCLQQHGFVSARSCATSLLSTLKVMHSNLDRGNFISAAYIDFARAFDCVPISLLLAKCEAFGIKGSLLRWLRAFLFNRTQSVRVGASQSEVYSVPSGVPQGSVLGPLLFNLYISDIGRSLPPQIHYSFYADDVKVFSISDPSLLQSALDSLAVWSAIWGIDISPTKSVVMKIGTRHPDVTFTINAQSLPVVREFKDLGVVYTDTLSFSPHITDIVARANARCAYIHRAFSTCSIALRARLFVSYVRPLLEYCSVVWNPNGNEMIKSIENVQRRFTRITLAKCRAAHAPYHERLRIFKLEELKERRAKIDLITAHKIIHGHVDVDPKSLFNFSTFSGRTRGHNHKLCIDNVVHSDRYRHFYTNRIVSSFNSLPPYVVNNSSFYPIHTFLFHTP